ncbi:MAG: YtxH domain-containing protein [Bacillus sp. (in: firmicutes)]
MNGKHLLLGIVAGAAIAGIGTLLCTPTSGKNLRKNLKENKDELQDIISDIKLKVNEMKEESVSASKVSKEAVKQFISESKDLMQAWKSDVEPHKNEIQKRIKEIENTLGELESVLAEPNK